MYWQTEAKLIEMLLNTSNRKGVSTWPEHHPGFLSSHNLLSTLLVPQFRLHVIFSNPGKSFWGLLGIYWCDMTNQRAQSCALHICTLRHCLCFWASSEWAVVTQCTPEAHTEGCLLSSLSYQSWSLNSCLCFLTQVRWFLVLADLPAKFPSSVDRDKAMLRKPIHSQGAGMTGLLARQSALSLAGKAAAWPSSHLPDRPTPSTAPLEQWDQDGHPPLRGAPCAGLTGQSWKRGDTIYLPLTM